MKIRFDRQRLTEAFRAHGAIAAKPLDGIDVAVERGDHALNEGLEPLRPLRPAAVLVGLIDRPVGLGVLFTRRTSHLAHHAGQISFPGGHMEPDDTGPVDTALRETEEEIGLPRDAVTVVGALPTYITRTGFVVTPVIGFLGEPLALAPDPEEVDEVFEVPLEFLMDPVNHCRCSEEFDGVVRHFFAIPYHRHYIWGATAGMLINLYEVLTNR